MDRLDPELLKTIADALHETVKCPVCLAVLHPPVTLCSSGHGICPDCKPHVNLCPTCREEFVQMNPLILHQLLEALPRSCQNKSLGCTDVYIPGSEHSNYCSYRTIHCKITECDWSGQSRKLQNHLTTSHSATTIVFQDEMCSEMVWQNFDSSQDVFTYLPIVAYDEVFWEYISMNTQVKKLCISLTHVSNCKFNCDYFAVITFKKGEIEYTYTIKVPADSNHVLTDFYEDCCMTIPGNMIARLVNDDSALVYKIRIIKEDK